MTDPAPDPAPHASEAPSDTGAEATIFAAFMLAAGLAFLAGSFAISSPAAIWPRGLSAMLVVLMAIHLAGRLLRTSRRPTETRQSRPAAPRRAMLATGWVRQLATAVWLLVYCIAAGQVGFGPAMAVLMPLYMWTMGFRRPVVIVAITAAAALVITFLFGVAAYVPIWESPR